MEAKMKSNFMDGQWVAGQGKTFSSENPATGENIWQGNASNLEDINLCMQAAKNAFNDWASLSLTDRIGYLAKFAEQLKIKKIEIAEVISKETGKPLWETELEVNTMINKLPITIEAYAERCPEKRENKPDFPGTLATRHHPHGVMVVFGPFNFPGHLPNGHIIPALLAGNTVVLKPSEFTPLVSEKIFQCWEAANLPKGVINLLQGGAETGSLLVEHPLLDGLLFTGSYKTGQKIAAQFAKTPEKMLALEMGGNNPLIVHSIDNIKAAVYHTIQSAFMTSGQRCTCARRLIVTRGPTNERFIESLMVAMQKLKIGSYTDLPEPFMGPVISNQAAERILSAYEDLISHSANPLVPLQRLKKDLPFLTPGLIDVTPIRIRKDEEIFGPLLQLIWVDDFELALSEANKTQYGLAAGLLSDSEENYLRFQRKVRAGIINWNRPLTGSSSRAPFGGIGHSGNHRPSGYYAVDYCGYPVASLEEATLKLPKSLSPGMEL